MTLSIRDGKKAVEVAREALEAHVRRRPLPPGKGGEGVFAEPRGVFVTLDELYAGGKALRGCIGFTEPVMPLGEAIQKAAAYAAEDPRFPLPVGPEELDAITVEVSVLTPPQVIGAPRRSDLPSLVRVGVDGLVVSDPRHSGLLLPQVATEQGWGPDDFLSEACVKAGLPPDAWLSDATVVEAFQAEIFAEETPRGSVVKVEPRR
jgi:uncharacterized protein